MNSSSDTNVSRREFVKATAATAAALSGPAFLTSAAFAEEAKPATGAGDKPLRLGFIGIGKMGHSHLDRFVGYKDVVITAVADVDTTRREHARELVDSKYGEFERKNVQPCKSYKRYKELLADQNVDAVLIAVPDHWHTAVAMDACKAKKDIYCEKPLTLTIDEARRLV